MKTTSSFQQVSNVAQSSAYYVCDKEHETLRSMTAEVNVLLLGTILLHFLEHVPVNGGMTIPLRGHSSRRAKKY